MNRTRCSGRKTTWSPRVCPRPSRAAPECDLSRSLVHDVRLDQLHVLELLGDGVAERTEPLQVGRPLRAQVVELLPVVDDRRAVREGLRAEAVLRVEVRDGEEEGQPGRELLGVPAHDFAVARAHPGVDDEHGPGAADDADVGDERDASVRDDEDTVGDLDRCVFDHGGVRGVCLGFGHDLSFPPADAM